MVRFAILVIGNLGEAGKISLHSMLGVDEDLICSMADKEGVRWLRNVCGEDFPKRICLHPIEKDMMIDLGLQESDRHQVFGSEQFIRLTPLKWKLIGDVMARHPELSGTLFSDLDILWRQKQESYLKNQNSHFIWAQDDTPSNSNTKHFCSGIMYWPNSLLFQDLALELLEYQKNLIKNGKLIPDEPAFNTFFSQENQRSLVRPLPDRDYVIGHKMWKVYLWTNRRIRNIQAIHANYLKGDNRKHLALVFLKKRIQRRISSLPGLFLMIFWKIESHYK